MRTPEELIVTLAEIMPAVQQLNLTDKQAFVDVISRELREAHLIERMREAISVPRIDLSECHETAFALQQFLETAEKK